MKLNKEWHLAHPMPKNPNLEQRLEWHIQHARHCRCREIPAKLRAEMKRRNINIK